MKDVGMASTFSTMLIHSSESIYKVALRKVQNFVKGRILETKLSGKIAASLCRCLVKIKPEIGVKVFVPHACDVVGELLTEDMINQEQLIDEELKFNMHILAEVSFHFLNWYLILFFFLGFFFSVVVELLTILTIKECKKYFLNKLDNCYLTRNSIE